jgi:two-component system, OmpR family, sensor histidine kinase KdpD
MARGQLRLYLGAAPGVGKTYAMLNEGRRRAERGEDVVVGVFETHGRRPTADQVGDLEVIPRKRVQYRDSEFEEMDLDALLARQPEVALVDELAHTNVPGSRNEKRWQDVEELLDAGIDVISTLNIQHLESLNDVVEQITGVKQRETIPDEVVRRADQLQLVDLAVETIRARLARGDIYPAERIDAALGNYFRPGNLGALRELALLWIADRVDEGLAAYRARHGIDRPWETRERVLVALTGSPDGDRLIRRAARMAQRANGELVAVHVVPQDGLAAEPAALLDQQRRLVEQLGGTHRELVGADVGKALVDAARTLNATQIVLGATRRSRWRELTQGSVINDVIRSSGIGLDVHVISREEGADATEPDRRRKRRPTTLPRRRVLTGFLLAAVGLPLLAWVLSHLRDHVGLPSVLLLFLLLVIGVSAVGGLWPALTAAVAGFLIVNWYFTPPLYTLTISEGENVLALVVFVTVAGLVSAFVALAARRAAEGTRARAEAEALARLAGSSSVDALLESLRRALGVDAVGVLHSTGPGWTLDAASGPAPSSPEEATTTIEVDPRHMLVLTGASAADAEERPILQAYARELAASLQLEELEAAASTAGSLAAANELRTALLSAVSHDLRTPLAAIKASVTSLLQEDVDWTAAERNEFLATIHEETDRLDALVGNLLDMSRLQTGSVELHAQPISLDEVIPAALRSLGPRGAEVTLDLPEDVPPVNADAGLLERALANIIANAAAYSPGATSPRVVAGAVDGGVDIRIVDRGPGVPTPERARMFLPFQRLGDSSREGVGLGLAVARGFIEAMNGSIELEDTPGGGLTVVVRLPAAR